MNQRRSEPDGAKPRRNRRAGSTRRDRQIVRILALLRILAQGSSPTVHELAAKFGTRRETIYRDLRVLQDAGYPVAGDERGLLSRPRLIPARVPEIRFSGPELDALLAAKAQTQIALPENNALSSAGAKLKSLALSQAAEPRLDELFEAWNCGTKDYRTHETRIAVLIEAILRQRRCHVSYQTPSRLEPKTYDFDPYRLLSVGGGLYVVGGGPKHAGPITLAVDRLLAVELSQAHFEIDPEFDARTLRETAFGISWDNPMHVVLRFRADQAPYVRERVWHPSQTLTDLPEGGVQLEFRAGGHFEIRRWILGWGDAVEVLAPAELRQEVSHILHAAAVPYRLPAAECTGGQSP